MKFHSFISSLLFFAFFTQIGKAQFFTNDGLAITNEAGLTITIEGDFQNQTKGADLGTINNQGTITLTGDWTNNSANAVFSTNAGTVSFLSTTAAQHIGGTNATGFYNLTLNNTSAVAPEFTTDFNLQVKNLLTMTSGNFNLAGLTATIGTAAATPGNIAHGETAASGLFYDGTIIRYFDAATVADGSLAGFFPMGTDEGEFFPIYVSAPAVGPGTGGTITLNFTESTGSTVVAVADDIPITVRNDAAWGLTTAGMAGGTYNVRARGTNLGVVGDVADLRVMLAGSVVGNPGANAGAVGFPRVERTNLSLANLTNTFYIGSTDNVDSPLPVELLSFDAQKQKNTALITWQTSSEINNDYFVVEHSIDGFSFSSLGSVIGAGNSFEAKDYQLKHESPFLGTNYYRLRQVDFDGTATYSAIKQLTFSQENELLVFPTLLQQGELQVLFGESFEFNSSAQLKIIDAKGSLIYSVNLTGGTSQLSLPFELFPSSGYYQILLQTASALNSKRVLVVK